MSTLECLPDELWLLLFDYLPSRESHRAFANLNRRLQALLRSTSFRLRLQNASLELEQLNIPGDRIDALAIDGYAQKLDISRLTRLTSLRLIQASKAQLEQIEKNQFEHLRSLTIVVCPTDHRLDKLLFGPSPLKHLERCRVPSLTLLQVNPPCSTLRSLRLNFCTMTTCSRLLTLLPNLCRLETAIVPSATLLLHTDQHDNLKCLKMSLKNSVKFIDLKPILARLSSLEKLHLSSHQPKVDEEHFNHRELIDALASQLNRLKKCHVQLNLASGILRRTLDDLKVFQ